MVERKGESHRSRGQRSRDRGGAFRSVQAIFDSPTGTPDSGRQDSTRRIIEATGTRWGAAGQRGQDAANKEEGGTSQGSKERHMTRPDPATNPEKFRPPYNPNRPAGRSGCIDYVDVTEERGPYNDEINRIRPTEEELSVLIPLDKTFKELSRVLPPAGLKRKREDDWHTEQESLSRYALKLKCEELRKTMRVKDYLAARELTILKNERATLRAEDLDTKARVVIKAEANTELPHCVGTVSAASIRSDQKLGTVSASVQGGPQTTTPEEMLSQHLPRVKGESE
ncbi:hypothetical protein T440DRAFT_558926 [Plenodomus tracheiphilus IPT5]|uniref:Uncharacterized protein n=1 Tax=Plenodomus tracheiphilus IPT5 TaxID=1408161 RepID=A0A6A7AQI1_9PLEO|nr:hypothetical protein T440DRAFT_558926 [Plenodomus tracheiphilus IPT5]